MDASLTSDWYAFAPSVETLAAMANNVTGTIRTNMRHASDKGRGAIYRWLKKHHRTIKAGFTRTDASWDSVVATMISEGVRGRGDVEPNRKTVSKIWGRLCRDLDEQAAKARRPHRSRAVGTWAPPAQVRAPPQRPRPVAADVSRAAKPTGALAMPSDAKGTADLPEHARAALADIRRQLAHVDRHIIRTPDED